MDRIKLQEPKLGGDVSLEKALAQRRSIRTYKNDALTLPQCARLLWCANGITEKHGLRAVPSAGALYPLEVYLVAGSVEGLKRAIYKYLPKEHDLVMHLDGDCRAELASAALGQPWVEVAPASIVIAAVYERTKRRYGERGERYVHMEAGHAAQNVQLQATALNLGSVIVGAFDDAAVKNVLALPPEEQPLLIIPVGQKRA